MTLNLALNIAGVWLLLNAGFIVLLVPGRR